MLIEAGSPGVEEPGRPLPAELIVAGTAQGSTLTDDACGPGRISLRGYLPASGRAACSALSSIVTQLGARLATLGWSLSASEYTDQDWSTAWRSHTKAVRVTRHGRSVLIRPTWSRARARPGEAVIEIDPSMAFGTGSHATTRMCIRALLSLLPGTPPARVLDVGTGTGVLAMAAVRLGAASALGVDIDPAALKIARANARHNKTRISLSARPVEEMRGVFDIIVANILSGELTRMAPALRARLSTGGSLVLSGLLVDERREMEGVFAAVGLYAYKRYSSGEWTALVCRKTRGRRTQ